MPRQSKQNKTPEAPEALNVLIYLGVGSTSPWHEQNERMIVALIAPQV